MYNIIQNFVSGNLFAICGFLSLVLLSAILAGSKISFFILSNEQRKLFSQKKNKNENRIINLLHNPEQLSATLLISNVLINTTIAFVWFFLFDSVFQPINLSRPTSIAIELSSIVFIILIFCEYVPRIIASGIPDKFCLFSSRVVQIASLILTPLSKSYVFVNSVIDRSLIRKKPELSISYLSDTIEMSEETTKENKKILEGIVSYGGTYCVEIMRPRVDVVAFDISSIFNELLEKIKECNYSRIPIYQETFDNIKGVLYVKDLLSHIHKKTFSWQTLIRPAYFVPESKKINDLLLDFQTEKIHLAIVTDEYGGTSGIVTLEDILEEIVGEIVGESDVSNEFFKKIDENNYIFEGKTLLNDFYKIFKIDDTYFDEVKGDADTLAGMILAIFGEIPKIGSRYSYKQFLFTIVSSDKRRIKQIQLTKI